MKIRLVNPTTKRIEERKVGFSWTVFFFGFLVPIFRADWKWTIIIGILGILTQGLSHLVLCFIYNGINIKEMLDKGFLPADEESRQILVSKGYADASIYVYHL